MQPLALTLKGFRGIRDGLGRDEITLDLERLTQDAQLIAIVGANGSGKSTIMDCLVPYIGLPSRAALAGAGGFSYYDHVYLPESVKDLTWAHEGRCYRSQIVIRLCGRRRTEAFLHTLDDAGHWRPVQLDDGMVSDGRVETYTRCVEAICGSAETFFTSVFAAQGKRQLSTYRNAEIKSLLADLLGQEEIQALGQKAAETVRLLKAGLATIRQELVGLDAEGVRLEATRRQLDGAGERVAAAERAKTAAHAALEAAQAWHARVAVEREQVRATEARRAQLAAERQSTLDTTAQARRALQSRDQAERQRLERLDQRVAGRLQQERSRRQALTLSRPALPGSACRGRRGTACGPAPAARAACAGAAQRAHRSLSPADTRADALPRGGAACRTPRGRHRARGGAGRAESRGTRAPVRLDRRGALRRHGPAGPLQAAG
jgi:exonuclease SbcC